MTYRVNDYTEATLPLHLTLSDVIYHKGNAYDEAASNFVSPGVESYENCYSLCLDMNYAHCFAFSYSPTVKNCIILHDDSGTTHLDEIKYDVSPGYKTYQFNGYATSDLLSHITLSGIIIYKGGSGEDSLYNFHSPGVVSHDDCYALCLDRNHGECFAFSFSLTLKKCCLPHSNASTHLDELTMDIDTNYTAYLFIDYTSADPSTEHRLSLDDVILYKGSVVDDMGNNFITPGVGSEQNCYALCMESNQGHCFSFSYSSATHYCRLPHDELINTQLIEITESMNSEFTTTLFTDHATQDLLAQSRVTLTDVVYDVSASYSSFGTTTKQDCYAMCLLGNSGGCFSFSFSSAGLCLFPLESANVVLDDITNFTASGYETIVFSTHASSILTSQDKVTLSGVIYYGGINVHDTSSNFISSGVEDEQTCYLLCIERNGGNCFSLSYSTDSKICRIVHGDSAAVLDNFNDHQDSDYITYLITGYTSSSMDVNSHVALLHTLFIKETNFNTFGVASPQDCYVICLTRNDNNCFSFSFNPTNLSCSFPVGNGSTTLSEITVHTSSGTTTYFYTGYTSNQISSVHRIDLEGVALHKGSDISNIDSNFINNGVTSEQDCYTMCLARNDGHCLAFAYRNSTQTCLVPIDKEGNTAIAGFSQHSSADYYTVVTAAGYETTLTSQDNIILMDYSYHLGYSGSEFVNMLQLFGVTSKEDCYTACLLHTQGHCTIFSYAATVDTCNVPDYNNILLPSSYVQEFNNLYVTYLLPKEYAASQPNQYIITTDSKWSSPSRENVQLAGVTSSTDCYRACYRDNKGSCYVYSFSSTSDLCYFPRDSGSTYIHNVSQSSAPAFSSYLFIRNEYALELSAAVYISLSNRLLHYGSDYDDVSANYAISGVSSLEDCYMFALMENSGHKISFSWSDTAAKCYVPGYRDGEYGIESLEQTLMASYTTVVFKDLYTETLPLYITTNNKIAYKGDSYDNSSSNFILYGVTSAQDCYTACLIRNQGRCIAFTYKMDECIVPLDTGTLNVRDLGYTTSDGYTTHIISNGCEMISNYATIMNSRYEKGPNSNVVQVADSVSDCAVLCQLINNGRCISFTYDGETCSVPPDTDSLHAQNLTRTAFSGPTTYLVVQDALGNDINIGSYTLMPDQYMFLGSGYFDSSNEEWISDIGSVEDCYRMCYLANGLSCLVFSYASSICYYPLQAGVSMLSEINVYSHPSYTTYFMFSTMTTADILPLNSYSHLSDLKIRDGRQESAYEIHFSGVTDVNHCYRLCLVSFTSCHTFSYNSDTLYCYLSSVHFHDEWTYVETADYTTGYFAKNSGSWKLITKHIQYEGVLPDDAFTDAGNAHNIVPLGDTSLNDFYVSSSSLKNNMIDYWNSLTSKYQLKMSLRNATGEELKYLIFDLPGTNKTSWFSSDYFHNSSYTDLRTNSTFDHWAMRTSGRTFYISHAETGYDTDAGWLQISATVNSVCTQWDCSAAVPKFMYSPGDGYGTWSADNATFDVLTMHMSFN